MFAMVQQALMLGYTAKQVLDYLSRKVGNAAEGIKNARTSGYSDDDILKFLSNKIPTKKRSQEPVKNVQERYLSGIGHKTREERDETRNKFIRGALGAAGTAIGAYGAYKSFFPSSTAVKAELMPERGMPQPNMIESQVSEQLKLPQITPQVQQQPEMPVPQQPITPTQPMNEQTPPDIDYSNIISQMGLEGRIKNLSEQNPVEIIPDVIEQMLTPQQKKWAKENIDVPFKQVVEGYLQQNPHQKAQKKNITPIAQETIPEEKEPEIQGNLAVLPDGIGEVKSIENDIATLDVDGKERKRKVEDVLPVPIPKQDLADIYEQLKNAIPENERSSVINFAGYDANANELAFRPHSGALYIYKDIPPEFAEKLKKAMFKAKTTGENFYGSWSQGEGSRFAGLGQLIRELQKQYGGKGKEYIRKYETLVDFLAAPEAAKKEKEKRLRDEKKRKKRK